MAKGNLTRRIGEGIGNIAEAGFLLALVPLLLVFALFALAALPNANALVDRLLPTPKGGSGGKPGDQAGVTPPPPATITPPKRVDPGQRVDTPKPTEGWTIVLNPSVEGPELARLANRNLVNMVAYYLGQAKTPLVNLAPINGYRLRLAEIAKRAKEGKKLFVVTLAAGNPFGASDGTVVAGVPQGYGSQNPTTLELAAFAKQIAGYLIQAVIQANNVPPIIPPKAGGVFDTFTSNFFLTRTPANPGVDAKEFHNTLYDGVYKGGTLAAFRRDEPLIVGPNGYPMPIPSVWLCYADNDRHTSLVKYLGNLPPASQRATAGPIAKVAEDMAGMIAAVLTQKVARGAK